MAHLELGANTATAKYAGADAGNYVLESVDIAITRIDCQHNGDTTILYAAAPTCTHAGFEGNLSCALCGKIYEYGDSIPAIGHKADSVLFENIMSSTCTETGSYDSVVYCSVCHIVVSSTHITTPANGHTVVVDEAVAATATTDGLTEGSHCSVCHETLVAQEIIPATGEQGGENQGGNEGQGNENQGGGNNNNEPATAVSEEAVAAVSIYAFERTIVVEAEADGSEIIVFDINGRMVAKALAIDSRTEIQMPKFSI